MKKIIAIFTASILALSSNLADAQVVGSENWGNGNPQRRGGGIDDDLLGGSPEEDALLQSLYNEEEDPELNRVLRSEDFIFPTSLTDNWHLMFQIGAVNSWGSYTSKKNFFELTNFGAAISIGKYLSPVNDVRLTVAYGRGTGVRGKDQIWWDWHESGANAQDDPIYQGEYSRTEAQENAFMKDFPIYHWNTLSFGAQWLPNLTNLFKGYDPDRKFTISGIMGMDLEHTWGYPSKEKLGLSQVSVWAESPKPNAKRDLIGIQVGLQLDYTISDRWHVNLEAQETFLDDMHDGLVSNQEWDGHLNIYAGLTWFLKSRLNNGRLQNRNPFNDKYNEIEERIYKNREALEDALANRPVDVEYVDVTKDVTYTLISFDEGVLEVPRLQQNNVFTTAAAYERNKNSKIFITNSSKVDDKTFHERAWSISKLLNNRWQVPLEDIWVDADESHIQKLQLPDCKHYIILIIND